MTFYAVNKYFDQIRKKEEKEHPERSMYVFFHTENEARQFIRKRSLDAYYAAEAECEKARRRHNRNCKRFAAL